MSAAELIAGTFFYAMKFDPKNPNSPDGDRFVLSKGHAAPALYAATARRERRRQLPAGGPLLADRRSSLYHRNVPRVQHNQLALLERLAAWPLSKVH